MAGTRSAIPIQPQLVRIGLREDPRTGKARNLGTFATRAAATKHERAVQYFKRG